MSPIWASNLQQLLLTPQPVLMSTESGVPWHIAIIYSGCMLTCRIHYQNPKSWTRLFRSKIGELVKCWWSPHRRSRRRNYNTDENQVIAEEDVQRGRDSWGIRMVQGKEPCRDCLQTGSRRTPSILSRVGTTLAFIFCHHYNKVVNLKPLELHIR